MKRSEEMNYRLKRRLKTETGFTLLEAVAATALAGLVIGVLAQVFLQCAYTQKQLEGRVIATVLGTGKLDELSRRAETDVSGAFPAPYRRYHWSRRTETLGNGLEKLELTIEWSGPHGISHQKTWQRYQPVE
jgi:type II secretory pathway pseudopilin PulG